MHIYQLEFNFLSYSSGVVYIIQLVPSRFIPKCLLPIRLLASSAVVLIASPFLW